MYRLIENIDPYSLEEPDTNPNGLVVFPISHSEGLYVDRVEVPPGMLAIAHKHSTSEVIHVLHCSIAGVATFYGPHLEYTIVTHQNQIIQIDKDVPHHVYNPGKTNVIALRYSALSLNENTELLPHLDALSRFRIGPWIK